LLDLTDCRVANSHRKDMTHLRLNFSNQQTVERLPPGKRRMRRWNGNPLALDGRRQFPGWIGRYLKIIE